MIGRAPLGSLLPSLFLVLGPFTTAPTGRVAPARPIAKIEWSADGSRVATWSDDDEVQLWDASSGDRVGRALRHPGDRTGKVYGFALSPDGTRLATAGLDSTARIWVASNGKPAGVVLRLRDVGFALAWSPDGRRLAVGTNAGWELWDMLRAERLTEGETVKRADAEPFDMRRSVHYIAFSPDAARFAVGALLDLVQVVTVASGAVVPVTMPELPGSGVRTLAWRHDGGRIALVVAGKSIRIVDAATGVPTQATFAPGGPDGFFKRSAAWNRDGSAFATRSPEGARIWNAAGGDSLALAHVIRLSRPAQDLTWSPDGSRLLVLDSYDGPVVVDAATGRRTSLSNRLGSWDGMQPSWSPDGRRVAFGEGDQLKIVEVAAP